MKKITSCFSNNWAIITAFLISIGTIVIFYAGIDNYQLNTLLNSDILYFPSLYIDIIQNNNSFNSWVIPGAPGFFPDMILYFLLMALTQSIPLSAFLFGIIQFLTILVLFTYLIRLVSEKLPQSIYIINALLLLLFIAAGIWGNGFQFTFHILSNTYHTCPFINTLICLILILKYFRTDKRIFLVYAILIGIIAIMSDKLFIIMFCVPMLITLMLFVLSNQVKQVFWSIGTIIIQMFLGVISFNVFGLLSPVQIRNYSPSGLDYDKIMNSWSVISKQITGYLNRFDFSSLIIVLSIIAILLLIFLTIKKFIINKEYKTLSVGLVFNVFLIGFLIIVFLTPIILGDYQGVAKIRYNIASFYIGVLSIGYLLFQSAFYTKNIRFFNYISVLLAVIFSISIIVNHNLTRNNNGLKQYFNYYPEQAMVIDTLSDEMGLKRGVATYWNSKKAWLFNKSNREVYSCNISGSADTWIVSNLDWYFKQSADTNKLFNFVMLKVQENNTELFQFFGQPLVQKTYGSFTIYKYPDFYFDKKTKGPIFLNR